MMIHPLVNFIVQSQVTTLQHLQQLNRCNKVPSHWDAAKS